MYSNNPFPFQRDTPARILFLAVAMILASGPDPDGEDNSQDDSPGDEENQPEDDTSESQTRGGGDSSSFSVDPARTDFVDPARTRAVDPARTK